MGHTELRSRTIVVTGRVFNSLGLEEIIVLRTNWFVGSLLLAGVVFAPTAVAAAPGGQEAGVQVRIYDRDHHDYHNWDDHEDHAYRGYLVEHHREYRTYNEQRAKDQRNYWKWRHQHPDHEERHEQR
jgi:hypothetical protein